MEETGFQSAIVRRIGGKWVVGTKVLAMNVSGKITMKLALLNTSGVRTSSPISAITHEIEKANRSSSAYPPRASSNDEWMRQPTNNPVSDMTMTEMTFRPTSATVRPTSTAD